ncbi:MAG: hypothetical protein ACI9WS_002126, partial [Paraglaciecola psychrophila]
KNQRMKYLHYQAIVKSCQLLNKCILNFGRCGNKAVLVYPIH